MVEEINGCIMVDNNSVKPKYKQIVDSVIEGISMGKLKLGQKIPSINHLSEEYYLSRDTAEKAYNILKKRQIITSVRGKGFYVARTSLLAKTNIMFMVNKLSSHKLRIYESFLNEFGEKAHVDLHIYHCDDELFTNLLEKNMGAYDYYVIMPHFKTEDLKHASITVSSLNTMQKIPSDKLVILDNNKLDINNRIEIYQDFENDIYDALKEALPKIKKYLKINCAFPIKSVYPYPLRILKGIQRFCFEFGLPIDIIDTIDENTVINQGELFITLNDSDLVNLIKELRSKSFEMGKEIGVISYNDTQLKDLLGISTVSTNFETMGTLAAQMLMQQKNGSILNSFNFIDRKSL